MPLELVRDWAAEYRPSALLRSPSEREFLPAALEIMEKPASPAGRLLALSISAATIIALTWATFGKIDIVATAPGRVMPFGNTKVIQPVEIGTVKAIHVADGDIVRKGQILVELDPIQSRADRDRYVDQLRRAELDLAKDQGLWTALQKKVAPTLAFPPVNASSIELEAATASMQSQFDGQKASIADYDQQIFEKGAEIAAAESSIVKYQASLPFVEQQADLRSQLMQLQFSNKFAYLQAQQALVEQRQQIVVLQNQLVQAKAQRLALIEKKSEASNNYQKTLLDDLVKAEAQVDEARAASIKAGENLLGKTLVAPIDGVVQQLGIHTVGGVVTPAQALMMIVPKSGSLIVQANVDNKDVGFIHVGQVARVKVETFNFTRYGLIEGTVTSVSRDAVAPEAQKSANAGGTPPSSQKDSQEPTYVAYIRLSRNWIDTESGRTLLIPGMSVTSEINTGRRKAIDFLLSPLQGKVSEGLHER